MALLVNTLGCGATAAAPGSSLWGDYMLNYDNRFVHMSDQEWAACVQHNIKKCRELRNLIRWSEDIDKKRAALKKSRTIIHEEIDDDERMFRTWKDMVNEPEKYGDDITEVLELEEKLLKTSKRWRVEAHWFQLQQEQDDKDWEHVKMLLSNAVEKYNDRMATRIQALVRGYQTRVKLGEYLNCEQCLAHCVCAQKVCNACLYEEGMV